MKIKKNVSKMLSLICAVAVILGSMTCLTAITASAEETTSTFDFSNASQATGNYGTQVTEGKLSIVIPGNNAFGYAALNYQLKKGADYTVTFNYSCKSVEGVDNPWFHMWGAYCKYQYNAISTAVASTRIKQLLNGSGPVENQTLSFSFTADQPDDYNYLGFYVQGSTYNTHLIIDDVTIVEDAPAEGQTNIYFRSPDQLLGAYKSTIANNKLTIGSLGWNYDNARAVTNYKLTNGAKYDVSFTAKAVSAGSYNLSAQYGRPSSESVTWDFFNGDTNANNVISTILNKSLTAGAEEQINFTFTANAPDGYDYLGFRLTGASGVALEITKITIFETLPEPAPGPGEKTIDFSEDEDLIGRFNSSVTEGKLNIGPLRWAWDNACAVINYQLTKGATYDVSFTVKANVKSTYNLFVAYGKAGSGDWNVTNGDKYFKQINNNEIAENGEKTFNFTFTADQPTGFDYLGFRMQGGNAAALVIDEIKITMHEYVTITLEANGGTLASDTVIATPGEAMILPVPEKAGYFFKGWYFDDDSFEIPAEEILPEEDMTLYAKWRAIDTATDMTFTFDEEDTDYWSDVSTAENSGAADDYNGYLSIPFDLYESHTIAFDYLLKSNTNYVLYYKYKGSGKFGTMPKTIITTADHAKSSANVDNKSTGYNKLASFGNITADWQAIGGSWQEKTVSFTTGEITNGNDKLAFALNFGSDNGSLQIDDIRIIEVPASSNSYFEDFEDGNNGLKNIIPGTSVTVSADPDDAQNNVLVLNKPYNEAAPYKLAVPAKLTANTGYTMSFRYKASISDQSVSSGDKCIILGPDGIAKDLGFTISNAARNSNYGHIGNEWQDTTIHFTVSESEARCAIPAICVKFYCEPGNKYVDSCDVYFDDILIVPDTKITFVSNGGNEISPMSVPYSSTVELPVPVKEGWIFKGWCSDESLKVLVDNNAPETDVTYYARWYKENDIDGNGVIDTSDLTELVNILLGVNTGCMDTADINNDSIINILDLVNLKKIFANVYTSNIPDGYNLVWSEEFNEVSIAETKFNKCGGHSIFDNSVNNEDNVYTQNGKAVLSTNYDSATGKYQIPMSISTAQTMNFKRGYLEIRAKVPFAAKGEWPALWSLESSASLAYKLADYDIGDYNAEIDFMEHMADGEHGVNTYQSQIHLWSNKDNQHIKSIWKDVDTTFDTTDEANEWHTFGYLWTETGLTVYCDGKFVMTKEFGDNQDEFDVYLPLIISLQNYEKDTAFATSFEIDYVRLYQNQSTDKLLISNK